MKTLDILKRRSEIIQSILPSDKMLAFSFNRDLVQLKLSRASTSSSALKFSLTVVNKMIKCKMNSWCLEFDPALRDPVFPVSPDRLVHFVY